VDHFRGGIPLKEKRLNDPSNTQMIHVDQMRGNHELPIGPVVAALLRQSGNLYRELGQFPSADAAFVEIQKAFRKAGIDSVAVLKNTPARYEVVRLHHSHGGKAEGKKMGGAVLVPA
jgi:hypothetical protein